MTDEAKAVASVAEFGTEALKTGRAGGSYLARIVGTIPEDLIGVGGGDWLHQTRKRRLAALEEETRRRLEKIEKERLTQPNPATLIPLLRAAVDETRDGLKEAWEALLANALVDNGKKVRQAYFETLKKMDPLDAFVLRAVASIEMALAITRPKVAIMRISDVVNNLPFDIRKAIVDSQEYGDGLVSTFNTENAASVKDELLRVYVAGRGFDDLERVISLRNLKMLECIEDGRLTPFGRGFVDACEAPSPVAS